MRDVTGPDTLVGWAGTTPLPLFHKPKRLDGGGSPDAMTGMSVCGVRLIYVDARSTARPYERPCQPCWHVPARDTVQRKRRVADVRPLLIEPVVPVTSTDLRVTHDGLLGVRSAAGSWVVFDPERPLMLTTATDDAAEGWRTLRSCWHDIEFVNGQQLADRYQVERQIITKWRRDGVNFPRPMGWIGDRPGWLPEQVELIDVWVRARRGRTGRPPKDPQ